MGLEARCADPGVEDRWQCLARSGGPRPISSVIRLRAAVAWTCDMEDPAHGYHHPAQVFGMGWRADCVDHDGDESSEPASVELRRTDTSARDLSVPYRP